MPDILNIMVLPNMVLIELIIGLWGSFEDYHGESDWIVDESVVGLQLADPCLQWALFLVLQCLDCDSFAGGFGQLTRQGVYLFYLIFYYFLVTCEQFFGLFLVAFSSLGQRFLYNNWSTHS